jgi:hypothetical protein
MKTMLLYPLFIMTYWGSCGAYFGQQPEAAKRATTVKNNMQDIHVTDSPAMASNARDTAVKAAGYSPDKIKQAGY